MKHIVMYSGGIGSWATAKRVAEQHGTENMVLLFTDTKIEDEDLYRFIEDTALELGCEMRMIADGRDIWEVFRDERFLGNSRTAPCSRVLKQGTARKWVEDNYKPDECILYLGIDWTEMHRVESPRKNWLPYTIEFPMTEEPYLDKEDMLKMLDDTGIKRPRLYALGFAHNNCGGFCVRAGQGHFANLLDKLPERYAYHEQKEQEMRDFLGKDVSILRKQVNGVKVRLTLKDLRENLQDVDHDDIGGCGCFVSDHDEGQLEWKI